ncbi:hypothetical protein ACT6QH_08690 [Xanthobacter sp. TB0139]|uniref:hypothetical protein n=1 Tax=Xanthobacter sp. TB0139 TaxID=3459178 RepID=UPI0040391296
MAFFSTSGGYVARPSSTARAGGMGRQPGGEGGRRTEGSFLIALVMLLFAVLLMATPALALLSLPADPPVQPVHMLPQPTRFA